MTRKKYIRMILNLEILKKVVIYKH